VTALSYQPVISPLPLTFPHYQLQQLFFHMASSSTVAGATRGHDIGYCDDCMEVPYADILGPLSSSMLLLDEGQKEGAPAVTFAESCVAALAANLPPPQILSGIVNHSTLLHWLSGEVRKHPAITEAETVVLITDTDHPNTYKHWKHTGPIWQDRLRSCKKEKWFLRFVGVDENTGLRRGMRSPMPWP
jgi:hypothetical protein